MGGGNKAERSHSPARSVSALCDITENRFPNVKIVSFVFCRFYLVEDLGFPCFCTLNSNQASVSVDDGSPRTPWRRLAVPPRLQRCLHYPHKSPGRCRLHCLSCWESLATAAAETQSTNLRDSTHESTHVLRAIKVSCVRAAVHPLSGSGRAIIDASMCTEIYSIYLCVFLWGSGFPVWKSGDR